MKNISGDTAILAQLLCAHVGNDRAIFICNQLERQSAELGSLHYELAALALARELFLLKHETLLGGSQDYLSIVTATEGISPRGVHFTCECEHVNHAGAGCPGSAEIIQRTAYGSFRICGDCANSGHMPGLPIGTTQLVQEGGAQ